MKRGGSEGRKNRGDRLQGCARSRPDLAYKRLCAIITYNGSIGGIILQPHAIINCYYNTIIICVTLRGCSALARPRREIIIRNALFVISIRLKLHGGKRELILTAVITVLEYIYVLLFY